MRGRRFAYLASSLAIASAAVSVFWTLGGTLLLDTVGGSIEKLARTRSPSAVALGAAASLAKVGAALLALALVRPWGRRVPHRLLEGANVSISAVLVTWGAANVLVGGLALIGTVSPADGLDEHALRWHVFVWDLWFLVWGVALAFALSGFRRANPHDPASRQAGDERRHAPLRNPSETGSRRGRGSDIAASGCTESHGSRRLVRSTAPRRPDT